MIFALSISIAFTLVVIIKCIFKIKPISVFFNMGDPVDDDAWMMNINW